MTHQSNRPLTEDEAGSRSISIGLLVRWIVVLAAVIAVTGGGIAAWLGLSNTMTANHVAVTAALESVKADIQNINSQIANTNSQIELRRLEMVVLAKRIDSLDLAGAVDHSDQTKLEKAVIDVKAAVDVIRDTSTRQGAKIDNLVEAINDLKAEIHKK